jgi:Fe-S oxidoreductase
VNKNIKKLIILAVIALVVAAYFLLDLNTYLTLENIKSSREEFSSVLEQRPFMVLGVFLAIYLSVVSLNLPGTRPETTWKFFQELKKLDSGLEMVLDCCHKPSHDLGRQDYFEERFQAITRRLKECGISEILVACPNCYKVFSNYGQDFQVKTVYQVLAENNGFKPVSRSQQLIIHDPCPLRYQDEIQASARSLLDQSGFEIKKIKKSGKKTICCGEGGAVGFHNPVFAKAWGEKRRKLAGEDRIVTYCAGCVGFLGRSGKVSHLGDVLFDPEKALAGKSKVSKSPVTYLNRLLLKRRLKGTSSQQAVVSRQ